MYVMAAGSGSWAKGAGILFFLGIGTLPLLMGFGFLTSMLSKNLTPKLLRASGVIVMALGFIMANRGLAVTGSGVDFNTLVARVSQRFAPTAAETPYCETEQTIRMEVLKSGFSPNKFTIRQNVPVKWVIDGKELNECNKAIVVPQYNLTINLHSGSQTIEFTPKEAGVVPWSCWMGMIPGTFIVIEDPAGKVNKETKAPLASQANNKQQKPAEQNWQIDLKQGLQKFLARLHNILNVFE
jgi:hypothetical protein